MLAVVVNDSIVAVILGVVFTGLLGLIAWIVKQLLESGRNISETATNIRNIDKRVEKVEEELWRAWSAR